MTSQLTTNAEALRLFFTEDIFLVNEGKEIVETLEFKFLGKNQKNILIIVNDDVNPVSTSQGTELLRKLVKAIDLTANDFALVNYAAYPSAKYEHFRDFFSCKVILAFGVSADALALPSQLLNQLTDYNNTKVLITANLDDLENDQASKKALWVSLQQLKP